MVFNMLKTHKKMLNMDLMKMLKWRVCFFTEKIQNTGNNDHL